MSPGGGYVLYRLLQILFGESVVWILLAIGNVWLLVTLVTKVNKEQFRRDHRVRSMINPCDPTADEIEPDTLLVSQYQSHVPYDQD